VAIVGVVLAGVLAAAVALAVAGGSDDEPLLPDLDQASPGELSGRTLTLRDGTSFFLGFESAAGNVGDGPLIIDGSRANRQQQRMKLVQRIRSEDGSTQTVPVSAKLQYVRSADHEHWHMLDFMRYELRRANGTLVAPDRKTGFCLGDRYEIQLQLGRAESEPVYTDECGRNRPRLLRLREGISVGYGDDYPAVLEGQYLRLSGLPAGRYVLVHRVNAGRRLRELDHRNNAASLLLQLRWREGAPMVRVLRRCPDADTCERRPPRRP
jgi:Lysyl oxidase